MSELLYLEDLTVGDTFKTDAHELRLDEIRSFAGQFDPQPFHLDEAAAKKHSIFGGLAASGWHTAAITMRLLVASGPQLADGIVGAGVKLDWKSPTRPGDVLHVESEVLDVTPSRSRPDRGTVMLRSNTINQRGDIVQTLTATLMVSRRPT
jgi:acyl dehydratase